MFDRQTHRGFSITVTARDDVRGGSNVTLLVERIFSHRDDVRTGAPIAKPEHYHSLHPATAAAGEAMQRARRLIDEALGERDPLEGE
ncbi:hypothetical protein [Paraburkholderia youngii]|uniref:Uncharacterized protein n=1 Tax=Paraburkholderia youngii TaxID=2782701 RepID=A0A7Y6N2D8_9BURK|nr:hypothetical protein [Paraburkholderia youngii]NUY06123.1 hypothetical protein [Paraburkholderia youngii]